MRRGAEPDDRDAECECPATGEHACPFAEELYDDSETMCSCCDHCTRECADDV